MSDRTLTDIALAKIYFKVLVAFAKNHPGMTITYGDLVEKAKETYPNDEFVESAIAVNIGRRLDTLREFTREHQVPDLSALVVNKITGDNGVGFTRSFDGDLVRQEISQFDWSSLSVEFETFIDLEVQAYERRQSAKRKPKKVSEDVALEIWWNYYKERKLEVGHINLEQKNDLIQRVMRGSTPAEALADFKSESKPTTKSPPT